MTSADDEAQPQQLPMVPDRIRQADLSELDRLQRLIDTLSVTDWSRPSAAEGWSIGDVAAHLSLAMRLQSQLLEAAGKAKAPGGMWKAVGELSRSVAPVLAPAFHAANNAIPKLIDRTLTREAVLSQFAAAATRLRADLQRIEPADYTKQIYYVGGAWPLSFFLGHILNELALHGWDIATTLDAQTRISDDARTVLPWFYWSGTSFMLRPPATATGAVQALLAEPELEMWWRVSPGKKDQGMGREPAPDVTINGDSGTFVLVLSGRIKPLEALRFAALEARGNEDLARSFLESWHVV